MAAIPRVEPTNATALRQDRGVAANDRIGGMRLGLPLSIGASLSLGAVLSIGAFAAERARAQTPAATETRTAPATQAATQPSSTKQSPTKQPATTQPPQAQNASPPAPTRSSPTPPPKAASAPSSIELRAGEYLWMPELAPKGPVVIVVSLPEQLAYVYRNGVRIAVSTVSTGKRGYETPTGVFTILQKSREHYSNLYDNAPMPFMQRLTWDGVALHAGKVPNYPASHGCVRLPYAFSEKLFGITSQGMTVVIADEASHAPTVAYPGLFAPVDPKTGAVRTSAVAAPTTAYRWTPELSPEGPITLVMSTHDRELAVLRNGAEIGRAPVLFAAEPPRGTRAYVLLEGSGDGASPVVPDRPALRWMALSARAAKPTPGAAPPDDALAAAARGDIGIAPEFARAVYDALTPGATLIVTDEALHARDDDDGMTVLSAERPPAAPPVAAPTPAPPIAPPTDAPKPND